MGLSTLASGLYVDGTSVITTAVRWTAVARVLIADDDVRVPS